MTYLLQNWTVVLSLMLAHLWITATALLISLALALPLGWLLHRFRAAAGPVMGLLGVIYTIPSIALIILLIPFLGLNARSVIAALILYNQVVLVRNILAGLDQIDPAVVEAARGMGMNRWQLAWKVEFPLALPYLLAGMRVAIVVSIAIATIGARFGAGGLGVLLFDGIAQAGRMDKIWIGALSVGLLAGLASWALAALERRALWRG
jgi:osmoprotectant transport system permease protein